MNNQTATSGISSDSSTGKSKSPDKSTSTRGFASMDQERQKEIASKGGKAAHLSGNAHQFTSEEAREAGRKGGQASQNSNSNTNANFNQQRNIDKDINIKRDIIEDDEDLENSDKYSKLRSTDNSKY